MLAYLLGAWSIAGLLAQGGNRHALLCCNHHCAVITMENIHGSELGLPMI